MKKRSKLRSSMELNIIGAIVLLLFVFGALVSAIGFISYTNAFKREYSVSTYHMADTATTLIDGDHLDAYLAGEEQEEYLRTNAYLDAYCHKISVSLIYVIQVDRSDYGSFTCIFDLVDNTVDNSAYTPWELGHRRDTTNEEYRQKYRALYEEGSAYETIYRLKPPNGQNPHITTIVPVKNNAGDVTALLCMQRPVRELRDARRPYLLNVAVLGVMLALISSALGALYMRLRFVNPLRRLSTEATRFAKENTKGEGLDGISPIEELSKLAGSIDTMETDMVRYIENLTAVTAEKERIGVELSLASTIQENSVPNSFPAFPGRTDFDVYAVMDPAKEVGGDLYNFFLIDEDHLALLIGDVSGKGIPAALFMMVTNILLSDRTRMGGSPGEILSFVNTNICEHNQADMFVTVWMGILELSTGKLTAANAGHEYPAWSHADGGFELLRDKHDFVIGGMDGIRYRDYELVLRPGDKLFLYTDGVPEASDAHSAMFGMDRMLAALNERAQGSPREVLGSVRAGADSFVQGEEQFDDLTMLCVEYRGPSVLPGETPRAEIEK